MRAASVLTLAVAVVVAPALAAAAATTTTLPDEIEHVPRSACRLLANAEAGKLTGGPQVPSPGQETGTKKLLKAVGVARPR